MSERFIHEQIKVRLFAVVGVFEELGRVILGVHMPSWSLHLMCWDATRTIKRKIKS